MDDARYSGVYPYNRTSENLLMVFLLLGFSLQLRAALQRALLLLQCLDNGLLPVGVLDDIDCNFLDGNVMCEVQNMTACDRLNVMEFYAQN